MFGLTTGLFAIFGGLFGWMKEYLSKKLDFQIAQQTALYERANLEIKARSDLANNKTPEIQFTRRIIVITLTALIVYITVYAINHPDATMMVVGFEQTGGGFLSWIFPFLSNSEVHYYEIPLTLVIGPIFDSYIGIVAFYVGSGGTQQWR